jgi:2-polyprenyl-6-methoxyphenol hydroxylase-like FAD-dependent oxidoreductase
MTAEPVAVRCCIAGGGPAGMMLGLLLARSGVAVLVLEKHADFLRDFRGDTIHPSTLEVMHELGLLDSLLELPHQEVPRLAAQVGEEMVQVADFSTLPTRCRFIAMMPQWDFLDFLVGHAKRYASFSLRMQAEATDLLMEDGRVAGLVATTPAGPMEVRADLVVAADGRHSQLREKAGLVVEDFGAPIDVLWFRLSRRDGDPEQSMGRFGLGCIFVLIQRGAYWQCGYVIPKGSIEGLRAAGLPAFRRSVGEFVPMFRDRLEEIRDWEDLKLLTVRIDRVERWFRSGLLCIGDAAHAMSPIGGVGINLAVQDAVAAANAIAVPLREGRLTDAHLARVQRRRKLPTRFTQRLQVVIQNRLFAGVLGASAPVRPPLAVRLLTRTPVLRNLPARLIGMGVLPEHVRTEATPAV